MIVLFILLGIAALAGIIGTVVSVCQDGYRRAPERTAERPDFTPAR